MRWGAFEVTQAVLDVVWIGYRCEQKTGDWEGDVDYGVRASRDAYGALLIVVRSTAQERDLCESTRLVIETALERAKTTVLFSEKVEGAGAAVALRHLQVGGR